MLRHNVEGSEEVVVKSCTKIRKRGALSSSGASNSLRKLRFKRGVLVGRRGSPCSSRNMSESSQNRHSGDHLTDGMGSSVSARKLVNALWQLNKAPSLKLIQKLQGKLPEEEIGRDAIAHRSLVPRGSVSEMSKRSSSRSKILEADEKKSWHNGHGHWLPDMMSNGSAMEVPTCSQDLILTSSGEKTIRLNDLHNSLIASKELVKVLAHIWGPVDMHPSTISLLSALRSELDLARVHVRRLIKEQKSDGNQKEGLKKQLLEEMEAWKSKQKEKVETTLQLIITELENEKKSRKRAERMNKKLGTALASKEASLQAATKELERERRSRERVERICNELIRGIGEDKVEVEELRRETEKVQEELEKEREMLQLADEWREERVQMKLLEARFQFEEKNAAIDQLRNKLEAFLETKKEHEPDANEQIQSSHSYEGGGAAANMTASNKGVGGSDGEIDSEGSDMHAIELNMDGNSQSYSWSCTATSKEEKTNHLSLLEQNLDMRRNASRHGSFSDRGIEDANLWGLDRKFQELGEELEGEWDKGCSDGTRNLDQDAERYQAIKNLRDQMLAGSGFILSHDRGNAERQYCDL